MKGKISFATLIVTGLSLLSLSIGAQQIDTKAPLVEYYVRVQRIDPVNGIITANGLSYYVLPDTSIWLDNMPLDQKDLEAGMNGLWAGIVAYDQDGRRALTTLHILKTETRDQNPAGGLR